VLIRETLFPKLTRLSLMTGQFFTLLSLCTGRLMTPVVTAKSHSTLIQVVLQLWTFSMLQPAPDRLPFLLLGHSISLAQFSVGLTPPR
jgi:hypothetical protein